MDPEHSNGAGDAPAPDHSLRDLAVGREETSAAQTQARRRPTLNGAVRRRRADRAFYIRLAGIMRQNERALERLKQ